MPWVYCFHRITKQVNKLLLQCLNNEQSRLWHLHCVFAPNCRSRWPKKKQGLKNHSSLFCTVNISLENDPVFSLKATVATLYPTLLMNWPVFLWIFLLFLCHTTKLPRALCNVHPLVLVKNVPPNNSFHPFANLCIRLKIEKNQKA